MNPGGKATCTSTRSTAPTASATRNGRSVRHSVRARSAGATARPSPQRGGGLRDGTGAALPPPRPEHDTRVAPAVDEVAALLARPGAAQVHRAGHLEDAEAVGE